MATEVAAHSPSQPSLLTSIAAPAYERHRPEETALYTVVREQLETFLARAREGDRPAPRFIEQELRAYLRCGILAHGFLRLHCDTCGHDRLVPFSCKRRGFCPSCGGGDDDALARDEPLLATLAAASLRSRVAMGPGADQRWRRLGDRVEPDGEEPDPETSPHIPQHGGMSLHANVAVPARDRRRLERLSRYVARPPLAHGRLEVRPDGRLALRLKTRWRDGTTHILMERRELLERLVPLIPPPRAHQVRYHGVLAPCASARDRVVLGPRPPRAAAEAQALLPEERHDPARMRPGDPKQRSYTDESAALRGNANRRFDSHARAGSARGDPSAVDRPDWGRAAEPDRPVARRTPWAELLQRVFEIDALRCPRCGAPMRLLAAIEDPEVARKILGCLGLPARGPPLGAAAGASVDMDHDSWDEESLWDFDQAPPGG